MGAALFSSVHWLGQWGAQYEALLRDSGWALDVPSTIITLAGWYHFPAPQHTFPVVRSAGGNATYNFDNPVFFMREKFGLLNCHARSCRTSCRWGFDNNSFKTDNAGPCFLLDWHLEDGVVLAEDVRTVEHAHPSTA